MTSYRCDYYVDDRQNFNSHQFKKAMGKVVTVDALYGKDICIKGANPFGLKQGYYIADPPEGTHRYFKRASEAAAFLILMYGYNREEAAAKLRDMALHDRFYACSENKTAQTLAMAEEV